MKSLKYAFLFCLVLVGLEVSAQRYARNDGNWNDAIWATTPSGLAGSASTPGSSDDVYTNGFVISVTAAVSVNNLYILSSKTGSIIKGGLGNKTITIYGELGSYSGTYQNENFTLPSGPIITPSGLILLFNGSSPANGSQIIQLGAWGANAPLPTINYSPISTGIPLSIDSDISMSNGSTLNVSAGTLVLNGNLQAATSSATLSISSGSTLLVSSGTISGSGTNSTKFPTVTVSGVLTSQNNTTSFINADAITLNSGSQLNVGYNGTNQTQGWWYQSNSPSTETIDQSSTVNYNSTASQNVYAQSYGTLQLSGSSSTKTVAGAGSINLKGNLTFGNSSVTLIVPSSNQTIFDGTNGQGISGGGTTNFNGGIQINKSSGTLTVSQDINWQGAFNFISGSPAFTNASTATATGVASIVGSIDPSFYSLTVSASGNLTSSSGNVNIAGNFHNNGTFNANGGTLTFNGVSSQNINGSSNSAFSNLTATNGGTITVSTPASLTGALTVSSGTFNANGNLTLISNQTTDARIAELPVSGASIVGEITMQRFMSNTGVKTFRYLASPFTDATVADWKAEFPVTGTFVDPSTAAQWSGQYPELVETDPSLFIYNEAHAGSTTINDRYESYPANGSSSSSTPLTNGVGYAAYMREASSTMISWSGTPKTGLANVSVTAQSGGGNDGWNLIGNPYPAPVVWNNVTKPGAVSGSIALQDNTGRLTTVEGYVYWNGVTGTGGYNGIIAAGQAFWVRATSSATITFEENDKSTNTSPVFLREGVLPDLLRAKLAGNGSSDELVIYFKEGADDAGDNKFDAFKLANTTLNFSSLSSDGKKLAINSMSKLSCDKEIALSLEGVTTGQYSINFSDFENVTPGVSLKLVDSFTGDTHTISSSSPSYVFSVTSVAASSAANRFKIKFAYPSVLANLDVSGGDPVCEGTNSKVTVSSSQVGINYYASINGVAVSDVLAGNGASLNIIIPHTNLAKGDNQVVVMATPGSCNAVALSKTAKITTDALASVSSITSNAVCKQGVVTLVATGAPVGGKYKWYESSDAINAIAGYESASFVTPSLNKSKTYYVAIVNSLGCEGARKEAVAKVTTFDDASITQVNETTLQSNFDSGNQWYLNDKILNGETGKTLTIKESGVYKLKVSIEGTCETAAERSMIVTGLNSQLENGQVYPNPVTRILSIKLPVTNGSVAGSVQNELGQSIGAIQFNEKDGAVYGEFDFEGRSAGIYIVRIAQGNSITNHKIVKK